MKKVAPLVLCLLLAVPVAAQKKQTDREHDEFFGPVKMVFVEWSPIYQSRGSIPPGSRCRDMTNEYDKDGRLMRHSVYPGSCGSDEIREDYAYAQDGSQTAKTQEIRGKDSPPPPGAIALPNREPEEKGPSRTVFKYDSAGRRSEAAYIRPSGRVVYKSTYTYDDKGRLTETTGLDGDGQVSSRRVYSYSGNERVPSGFTYLDGKGKVYERTVYSDYEFNSQRDWVKRKATTEETLNRRTIAWTLRQIEYYPARK